MNLVFLRNKRNKSEDVIEALTPTPKLMYKEGWVLTLKGLNVLTWHQYLTYWQQRQLIYFKAWKRSQYRKKESLTWAFIQYPKKIFGFAIRKLWMEKTFLWVIRQFGTIIYYHHFISTIWVTWPLIHSRTQKTIENNYHISQVKPLFANNDSSRPWKQPTQLNIFMTQTGYWN